MQDCSNSIANALELLQFCTKPSTWSPNLVIFTMKIPIPGQMVFMLKEGTDFFSTKIYIILTRLFIQTHKQKSRESYIATILWKKKSATTDHNEATEIDYMISTLIGTITTSSFSMPRVSQHNIIELNTLFAPKILRNNFKILRSK